jgi:ABC-type phosphate transport system substrate-binding protein
MKPMWRVASLLAALAPAALAQGEPGEFKVVVNPSNPVAVLPRAELARMFLKKVSAWPDGTALVPVDQSRTSPTRVAFSAAVIGKPADAVAAYWQTLVSAGHDTPPEVKHSDQEVLELVRRTPGAVGYVSGEAPLDRVKALAIR